MHVGEDARPKLGRLYLPIPGFPGYFAGTDGSNWSSWTNENPSRQSAAWRRLKQDAKYGRNRVHIGGTRMLVGWLVLMAFKGPSRDKAAKFAWHKDDDLLNDCLENLEWSHRPQERAH